MLATAWGNSLIAEIRTFKALSEIGAIESRPNADLYVQLDEVFIDNKDEYSGLRKEQQLTATFLKSESESISESDVLLLNGDKYKLQAICNRDEISVTYIALLL
ncbi:MAG: hypothetical protein HRU18_08980 [Pseudoalteromonas sp.]|uniref:hypothetical protein n=1 Tax=Pseudoalteromonas sp. TaxID=53249 RepID=UPI001D328F17|nr:hypothetical protein [Pseudoalteromonas sp.]NRA78331.1 hypothetical protein [Pseudoalteromonas sp.]